MTHPEIAAREEVLRRAQAARWAGPSVPCPHCETEMSEKRKQCGATECRRIYHARRVAEFLRNYKAEYGESYACGDREQYREKRNAASRRAGYTDSKRSAGQRRRAIVKGGAAEKFSTAEIYERDGWRCGVCGKKVNRRLKHPNPMSVSLDHVVPLSKGGEHARANVRCAHLGCNIGRGNRGGGEQLRLVG